MGRFQLTSDWLVEGGGGHRHFYGRWDRQFRYRREHARARPDEVPTWPIFDGSGVITLGSEAGDVSPDLQDWAALIPAEVRRIAGAFSDHQWVVLEAMREAPALIHILQSDIETIGSGFFTACFALHWTVRMPVVHRRVLYRRLAQEKRRDLIKSLSGHETTRAARRTLGRLVDVGVRCPEVAAFLTYLEDKRAIRSIARLQVFDAGRLSLLRDLDSEERRPSLIDLLFDLPEAERRQAQEVFQVLDRRSLETQAFAYAALHRVASAPELRSWMQQTGCFSQVGLMSQWPDPPWPGSLSLRPLRSVEAVLREGVEMDHCLGESDCDLVQRGGYYLYRCLGPERATVAIRQIRGFRWEIHEIAGRQDRPVSESALAAIRREFGGFLGASRGVSDLGG